MPLNRSRRGPQLKALTEQELLSISKQVNKEVIGPLFRDIVLQNFMGGGAPRFKKNSPLTDFAKRLKGSAGLGHPLVDSGKLFEKAILNPIINADAYGVELKIRNPTAAITASARALHDGAAYSIMKTPAMRRFFFAKYYEAKGAGNDTLSQVWLKMAVSRVPGVTIIIPPRPWTVPTSRQVKHIAQVYQAEMQKRIQKRLGSSGGAPAQRPLPLLMSKR